MNQPLSRDSEQGSAFFVVAVSLLLLMGFAALALDGSLGYNERRGLQNTADNAAYAAAYESCNPRIAGAADPSAAANSVAAQNGYNHNGTTTIVTTTETVPGEWTVEIASVDLPGQFGQATPYANNEITVRAAGTATCTYHPFLGGYAVFAGAPNCSGNELSLSGSNITVTGAVHSNQDIQITGSDPAVIGEITYVYPGGANLSGGNTATTTSHQEYPIDPLLILEYQPGGDRAGDADYFDFTGTNNVRNNDVIGFAPPLATGNQTSMVFTRSGILYAPGDMDLTGVSTAPGIAVTLIAEGEIKIVANGDIVGYDPIDRTNPDSTKLTAFSWNHWPLTCAPGQMKAVTVSASGFSWEGVIFAPNGQVSFSAGTAAAELNGSIIAFAVDLSGANLTVTYDDSANADPLFTLDLLR